MTQLAPNRVAVSGLDRDLFCLQCGYNLRGLAGDPVRCPECGYNNDLGIASIPADLIRSTLHEMETYPTWCVVMSAGLAIMILPASTADPAALLIAGIGAASCFYGWWNCYQAAGQVYQDRTYLRRLLFSFHAISLICVLPFVLPPLAYRILQPRRPEWLLLLLAIGLIAGWSLGLWWYRRVRQRLAATQRETAVRIARSCVQNWRWQRATKRRH